MNIFYFWYNNIINIKGIEGNRISAELEEGFEMRQESIFPHPNRVVWALFSEYLDFRNQCKTHFPPIFRFLKFTFYYAIRTTEIKMGAYVCLLIKINICKNDNWYVPSEEECVSHSQLSVAYVHLGFA